MKALFPLMFQALVRSDPRGVLQFFCDLPADSEADVAHVTGLIDEQSTQDSVLEVREGSRVRYEFLLPHEQYDDGLPERMAVFATGLVARTRKVVRGSLVLFREYPYPVDVPTRYSVQERRPRVSFAYRVHEFWKLDPEPFLAANRAEWLPWIPLMRANPAHLKEAERRLAALGDPELESEFVLVGRLREGR